MEKKFKKRKWRTIILVFLGLSFATLMGLIWFSPYTYHPTFKRKMICHTVEINVPVDSLFRYLGNSANARNWSVYVDHITPLNNGIKDGHTGSVRRCFCNKDEKGRCWDEKILVVEKNKRRRLSIFNLVGFTATTEGLVTEQVYQPLSEHKTKLSFTVFYDKHVPNWWEILKTKLAAYKMLSIFKANMANIKRIVETGR